jgi:hypothetical protein
VAITSVVITKLNEPLQGLLHRERSYDCYLKLSIGDSQREAYASTYAYADISRLSLKWNVSLPSSHLSIKLSIKLSLRAGLMLLSL